MSDYIRRVLTNACGNSCCTITSSTSVSVFWWRLTVAGQVHMSSALPRGAHLEVLCVNRTCFFWREVTVCLQGPESLNRTFRNSNEDYLGFVWTFSTVPWNLSLFKKLNHACADLCWTNGCEITGGHFVSLFCPCIIFLNKPFKNILAACLPK